LESRRPGDEFIESDVRAILKIPLGRNAEDAWAWDGEKHGLYSVKTAYRLLEDEEAQLRQFKEMGASSSVASSNPIWKKLWSLKIPPKVRVFWWRVLNNFLPTQAKPSPPSSGKNGDLSYVWLQG
jgi:hypothetical protein